MHKRLLILCHALIICMKYTCLKIFIRMMPWITTIHRRKVTKKLFYFYSVLLPCSLNWKIGKRKNIKTVTMLAASDLTVKGWSESRCNSIIWKDGMTSLLNTRSLWGHSHGYKIYQCLPIKSTMQILIRLGKCLSLCLAHSSFCWFYQCSITYIACDLWLKDLAEALIYRCIVLLFLLFSLWKFYFPVECWCYPLNIKKN